MTDQPEPGQDDNVPRQRHPQAEASGERSVPEQFPGAGVDQDDLPAVEDDEIVPL